MRKNKKGSSYLALVIVLVIALVVFLKYSGKWALLFPSDGVTLSLSPQMKTVKAGETFSMEIVLDASNSPIDGVDLYSLHYDPALLQVVDSVPNKAGKQIKVGTILTTNAANIVDEKAGTVKFSQVAERSSFQGKGVLATVDFKALKVGTAQVKIDFTKGSTLDTNTAFEGQDKLEQVMNATYTIVNK